MHVSRRCLWWRVSSLRFDLEMRISLAPYDAHDDVLDATEERLSGDEMERRRENQDDFASALKEGAGHP